jgi:hypothetical protein
MSSLVAGWDPERLVDRVRTAARVTFTPSSVVDAQR